MKATARTSAVRHTLSIASILALALLLLAPAGLRGHAGIDERLKAMDKRVAADPDNPDLYIKRGELHRQHHDWDAALADYQRALDRDPQSEIVPFVRGRMFFEAGRWVEARADLDHLLGARPDHGEGLLTRARLLVKLDQPLAAAADYDKVIVGLSSPTPEYYLERAKALASAGPEYSDRALAGIDQGIKKLGPIFTLVDFAIELELKLDRADQALSRLDQIRPSMAPERWFHRRGVMLSHMGRTGEARASYQQALESLRAAPPHRQSTRAAKDLDTELLTLLDSPPASTASF
ncbi:MAG: tetratricopeptide repeat protein [Acidobacteria bacterium]|nr:tetratricopeptide repeat protein [Acidobacteriota bacterium]